MATFDLTSGDDFVHVAGDGRVPPAGVTELAVATDLADLARMVSGGTDYVYLGGANDTLQAGAFLDATDTVDTVLSYENIVKAVRAIVAASHFHLIETLAEKVAAECLTHYTVNSVKVKIEKPDIFPDAATVGIEIERP